MNFMKNLTKNNSCMSDTKTSHKTWMVLQAAAAGLVVLLSGCGDTAREVDEVAVVSTAASDAAGGELLPLTERAERAKVSLEVAKTWEKQGVYIANSGLIYSKKCPVSRSVKIPTGSRIIC